VKRGKELRSAFILKLFAVERIVRALVFGVLAYALWRFSASRLSLEAAFDRELPVFRSLLRQLGFNVDHSKLLGLIQSAFTVNSHTLTWLAIGALGYAVVEVIEAAGLWLGRRWGEYFAMIATSAGLPFEIYELTDRITVLRLLAFAINLALVAYLIITKRLIRVRGGKKAYVAHLRGDSILETAEASLATAAAAQAVDTQAATHVPAPDGEPAEPSALAHPPEPSQPSESPAQETPPQTNPRSGA
jgi:uncharacterized membrane protein (DUF2068 family)